ncbi:hypothetical protein, partial [Schnuerera sp.]|uniref:hypothetical protein n=1 Tax=Schnuerera sp. TaxID=2794844 RepID=UPI002B715751
MRILDWIPGRRKESDTVIPIDDTLSKAIRKIEYDHIEKSTGNTKAKAYEEPLLGNMSMNPDYKEAPSIKGTHNLL